MATEKQQDQAKIDRAAGSSRARGTAHRTRRPGYTLDSLPVGWAPPDDALTDELLARMHRISAVVAGEEKAETVKP